MIRTVRFTGIAIFVTLAFAAVLHAQVTTNDMRQGIAPKVILYKTIGGVTLNLYVFLPSDLAPGDKRTAVVWIHGGAWTGNSPALFFPHCRYYALRGAVAISVQYRLVGSTGNETVFDCIRDCRSAMRYIRGHARDLGIDPDRIAVMGDSAGGHLAACLGIINDFDEPGEGVSISPVPNAMALYEPVLDLTVYPWVNLLGPAREASPLFFVGKNAPPAIVLHGFEDIVVPVATSIEFNRLMAEQGNRCDLVVYGKTEHGFVVLDYIAPDSMVARAVRAGDDFLVGLGLLTGHPTLSASQ